MARRIRRCSSVVSVVGERCGTAASWPHRFPRWGRKSRRAGSIPAASSNLRFSLEIHAPIESLAHYRKMYLTQTRRADSTALASIPGLTTLPVLELRLLRLGLEPGRLLRPSARRSLRGLRLRPARRRARFLESGRDVRLPWSLYRHARGLGAWADLRIDRSWLFVFHVAPPPALRVVSTVEPMAFEPVRGAPR